MKNFISRIKKKMTSFLPLTWIVYRYIILIYVLFGNDEKSRLQGFLPREKAPWAGSAFVRSAIEDHLRAEALITL